MKSTTRIAIICSVMICLAGVLWMTAGSRRGPNKLTYSQFLEQVRTGQVISVMVIGSNSGVTQATYRLKDGKTVRTVLPSDSRPPMAATQSKLDDVEIQDASSGPLRLFINTTPFFLLVGVWVFFMMRNFPKGPRQSILG